MNKTSVIEVVVYGNPMKVVAKRAAPLQRLIASALRRSGDFRKGEWWRWEVRDAVGALLERQRSLDELRIKTGDRIFISPPVGAGG